MKSILLSGHPEMLVNILNGKANILIRNLFPKDYIGWVYIYCTKGYQENKCLYKTSSVDWEGKPYYDTDCYQALEGNINQDIILNGKVVARFWCNKVEEIKIDNEYCIYEYKTETLREVDLVNKSFIGTFMLYGYLKGNNDYTIHISKLEIFDRPKELNEFIYYKCSTKDKLCKKYCIGCGKKLIHKAPQNYCYIEEEE